MDFLSLAQSLSHAIGVISLDDNSVSVLAMLAGIVGGWTVTGMRKPKPQKIRIERKDDSRPRKPD
jgi:hypothetical protein